MIKWSIIIFCYNEEKNIKNVVLESSDFLKKFCGDDSEIILINDGSTDQTLQNVQNLQSTIPSLQIINIPTNLGIGNALNTGYNLASGEYICAIPGDGQFDINELKLIDKIPEKSFISFYRPQKNYSPYRSILTWGNYYFNKWIIGIEFKDVNWIKVYTHQQLNSIKRELNSSLVESEIVAKIISSGYNPIYYSSTYLERINGEPKGGNLKTLIKAIKEMLYLKIILIKYKKTLKQQ